MVTQAQLKKMVAEGGCSKVRYAKDDKAILEVQRDEKGTLKVYKPAAETKKGDLSPAPQEDK